MAAEVSPGSGPLPSVAAVGCGYWGKNIVRNFAELGALRAVCDADPAVAAQFAEKYGVPARSLPEIFADSSLTAVAFASPAALHMEHAGGALKAGKHVFVEKPLALTVPEGRALAKFAREAKRILMVGHLLQYHPLVLELVNLVRSGRLGEVKHVYSNRLNIGKVRTEEDVIWSFAPHDLSVILAIIGEMPSSVSVEASCILDPRIADIANIHLTFAGGVSGRVFVSWLNPYKEQRLSVIGTKAHAVFDDTVKWEDKLLVYDHRIEYRNGRPEAIKAEPVRVVVEQREPLREECAHFLHSIVAGTVPRTDTSEALRVLSVLDAASRSLTTGRSVTPDMPEDR
jgi:UDP-2-acetamido-3-amino-2,3-dideoxy-glucuronate N-acetyltransferase